MKHASLVVHASQHVQCLCRTPKPFKKNFTHYHSLSLFHTFLPFCIPAYVYVLWYGQKLVQQKHTCCVPPSLPTESVNTCAYQLPYPFLHASIWRMTGSGTHTCKLGASLLTLHPFPNSSYLSGAFVSSHISSHTPTQLEQVFIHYSSPTLRI